MKTEALKKILILVTRVTNDSKKNEYANDWKNGGFKCCKLIDGVKNDHFKACFQDRTLIVFSGDALRIGNYFKPTDDSDPVDNILKFYDGNTALFTLLHDLRQVVPADDNDGKILVALHWNNRLLIGDIGKEFQNFANDNSLQENFKGGYYPFRFEQLFKSLGWSPDSDEQEQNQFIRNLPEHLKFPDNCQYSDYTIGGDRSILPQVRGMVNSLENNFVGFDKAFDDLWGGIKGSYTILHMVSTLLGYLKIQLYDAGQSPQHIKKKEEIIRSIKYLCTGELSGNILQEAEKILRREENLKDWILSDFYWGKKAKNTLKEYLANLSSYIENYKSDEFISFCSEFRDFIQDIAIGKKPKKINVD